MSERRRLGKGLAGPSYWKEQREAEDSFRILAEKALDFVGICNADNTFRYVNPASERVLGYKPDELVGTLVSDLLHPDDLYRAMSALAEALSTTGPVGPVVFRYQHKDGSWRWIEGKVSDLLELPGVRGVIHSGRDATERKEAEEEILHLNEVLKSQLAERNEQLEALAAELEETERKLRESEERFRITFEGAAIGIAHVGVDGRFLRVNRKLCEITGYTREELLARTFQDITHPKDLGADLDYARRVLSGEIETYSMERRYVRKDSSSVWVNLTVSLVRKPSGEPEHFISFVEDIDERKKDQLVLESLTPRETEVLSHLALGKTNREIAQSLNLSESYVKLLFQEAAHKLGVSNRAQAAARTAELGLLRKSESPKSG